MKSMTGFGRATAALGAGQLTVQISSVNRKTLDLKVTVPEAWADLEAAVAEEVRKAAARGAVYVKVEYTGAAGAGGADFDEAAVSAWLDRLAAFADARGRTFEPDAAVLAAAAAAFRRTAEAPSAEEAGTVLLSALAEALRGFVAMRTKEGDALLADFTARIDTLEKHIAAVAARAPEVVPAYRENLLKRLREAGLEIDLADERVLKEIALFADRCDIAEELTRLRSHLAQLRALFTSKGEIGRKAEFILQEVGREVHTIGSKANDLTIARGVIELKNELERIREQVANVE